MSAASGWRTTAVALLLLAPAVLGGCDDSPDVTAASPVERIVERGLPRAVEVSGRGQVLVSYVVNPEDDEGTYASSWRLYDTDGARVRDGAGVRVEGGSATPLLWPLPDGFLMARRSWAMGLERIDSRGVVSSIPFADRAVPTRPGDVLVTEATASRARLYRPDDQTSYRLPELPRGDLESVAIDQLGGVWVVRGGDRQETLYSPDGRAPWRAARLRLPVGAFAGRLSVAGDRVLLRARDTGSTGPRLAALLAQDTGAPGRWRSVDLADVDSRGWDEPVVAGLPGGRVLLGDWGRRWYAGTSGDWRRLELPDDQEFALEVHGDLVFATSGLGELFVSDDDAATWTNFDR